MHKDEIKAVFDQMAPKYDEQWKKTAPIKDALLLLVEAAFAELPSEARVLCVGAGTGEELLHLARRFPHWTFTAVDPSEAMVELCHAKATQAGIVDRCQFHAGYVESLSDPAPFDAATCFLVSQFILEPEARSAFFRSIAERLKPAGLLASSDLAADSASSEYAALLQAWLNLMAATGVPPEGLERMRAAYSRDVAILAPTRLESIIRAGGFATVLKFYQAGLIQAWVSQRA